VIIMHERRGFTEFVLPLGKLEPAPANKGVLEPKTSKPLEGKYTHLVYYVGPDRSPLEVSRNYEDDVKAKGGRVLYSCKEAACGGSPNSNVNGGPPGLINTLYSRQRAAEPYASPGYCAMDGGVDGLRYSAVELGGGRGYASIITYTIASEGGNCSKFVGGTFVTVDIVETKAREQRMVTVKAADMAEAIDGGGKGRSVRHLLRRRQGDAEARI